MVRESSSIKELTFDNRLNWLYSVKLDSAGVIRDLLIPTVWCRFNLEDLFGQSLFEQCFDEHLQVGDEADTL